MEFKNQRAEGVYKNLECQLKKVAKHNRQGSFETRKGYLAINKQFARYLANEWGLQKMANVQDKHVRGYIESMQREGLAAATIKTRLGAIRSFHDQMNSRYEISPNSEFQLEKRVFGGVDRAWSQGEYDRFKEICTNKATYSYERTRDCSILAREMGLRIHECTRIDRNDAEKALRTGELHIKGKGGKERDVPLTEAARDVLRSRMAEVARGDKLFIKEDEKTHLVIKSIQNNINRSRALWSDERGSDEINRSFHGLRHTYAREQYEYRIERGMSEKDARKEVSQLLGHERDEVTRIYLAQ